MHMVGHHHIAHKQESILSPNSGELLDEHIPCPRCSEQGQPPVATEGHKMKLTLPVVPLQSRRHSTPKIPTLKHRGWGTLATLHPNEVQQWYPLFAWRRQEKTKTSAWATRPKGLERKPQYLEECPFCGVPIVPVWWQRTLHSIVALVITLAIPAYLGLGKGLTLVFPWALLFCIPAMLLAQILVITIIPPKYVRKGQSVTTLFQR